MIDAESVVWMHLRNRRLNGFKFRREHPIGNYIVDFVCMEIKLIVEVDGGQHAIDTKKDEERTQWLNQQGYCVIRFWNHDVLKNRNVVLDRINDFCTKSL